MFWKSTRWFLLVEYFLEAGEQQHCSFVFVKYDAC